MTGEEAVDPYFPINPEMTEHETKRSVRRNKLQERCGDERTTIMVTEQFGLHCKCM
jgi:hypothetical protein